MTTGLKSVTKSLHRKDVRGNGFATTIKLANYVDEFEAKDNKA